MMFDAPPADRLPDRFKSPAPPVPTSIEIGPFVVVTLSKALIVRPFDSLIVRLPPEAFVTLAIKFETFVLRLDEFLATSVSTFPDT